MSMDEATITINGVMLSTAQSAAVRCAIENMSMELSEPDALGADDTGRAIAESYKARITELRALLYRK